MSFRRSDDVVHDFQLTDAELEIARQVQNGDLRQIMKREGAGLGRHTQAYLKLAARVRAERVLHQELLLLRAAKEQLTSLAAAEEIIADNHSQIRALQRELERTRNEHVKELAAPAMAVHAAPTGR
jgi:hypothetical protein